MQNENNTLIRIVGDAVYAADATLSFCILDVGARPLDDNEECFYSLLDIFPQSKILAFEVDDALCNELNHKSKPGVTYYPVALGRKEETRPFYVTNHPMCCSLYEPNEALLGLYNNMQVAKLKEKTSIETKGLDQFIAENDVAAVDFIKIDIQGAELEVFEGGENTLKNTLAIVSEVEFVPHYIDQPLFGDVCAFLSQKKFMFHKFIDLGGRTLKPVVVDNDPNSYTQLIWSDALFMRNVQDIENLESKQLLKLGVMMFLYNSPDVALKCFGLYDKRHNTQVVDTICQGFAAWHHDSCNELLNNKI